MRGFSSSVILKFDDPTTGNAGVGKTITVYDENTTNLSTIFTDETGLVLKANPFLTDDLGRFTFFADDGVYDIVIQEGEPDEATLPSIQIADIVPVEASNVSYDNATSGLAATDVQSAVDELDNAIDNIGSSVVNTFNTRKGDVVSQLGDYDADIVAYDNATSGLAATQTQAAIDEVAATLSSGVVSSFNTRQGDVVAAAGDYTSVQITYDNATSGLTATDAQAAIDELDTAIDTINAANYVNTFNTRTGDVVPVAGDYTAVQITYDNTNTGLTAVDTQAAIDEHILQAAGAHAGTAVSFDPTSTGFASNNIQSAIDEFYAEKDAADGFCPLDANSKVPLANIPDGLIGAVVYQGTWDALNNVPALASGVGTQGHYYVVNVAGTTDLDG